MNSVHDPLATLHPLHSPPAIAWWPPAPGWWVLTALLLAVVIFAVWYRRRTALRRSALAELRQLEQSELDGMHITAGVNLLLRRVALSCYPKRRVAAMSGQEWLHFLDSEARIKGFIDGPGQVLASGPYAPDSTPDRSALIELTRHWIRANCRRHA